MNYILTEDTTAGYDFWSYVCKYLLDGKFQMKDVVHRGQLCGIGGLADYIQTFNPASPDTACDEFFFIIDFIPSNQGLMEDYRRFENEAKKHSNVHIIKIVCYEHILLSFSLLPKWLNLIDDSYLSNIRSQYLRCLNVDRRELNDIQPSDNELFKLIINSRKRTPENIAKSILKEVTSNTGFEDNRHEFLNGFLLKSLLGECWCSDCCIEHVQNKLSMYTENALTDKQKSRLSHNLQLQDKWIQQCNERSSINKTTEEKFKSLYHSTKILKQVVDTLLSFDPTKSTQKDILIK